jgi:hypothetical protein
MGVVHVLCKVVNEVMPMCCCCADACMPARKVFHPGEHGGVSYPPLSNLISLYFPHSLLLPSLISVTSLIHLRLTSPHLPLSLPLLPPNTQAQSEPNFGKVVGWFENLIASIRIKIWISKNSPVSMLNVMLCKDFKPTTSHKVWQVLNLLALDWKW